MEVAEEVCCRIRNGLPPRDEVCRRGFLTTELKQAVINSVGMVWMDMSWPLATIVQTREGDAGGMEVAIIARGGHENGARDRHDGRGYQWHPQQPSQEYYHPPPLPYYPAAVAATTATATPGFRGIDSPCGGMLPARSYRSPLYRVNVCLLELFPPGHPCNISRSQRTLPHNLGAEIPLYRIART